MQLQPEVKREEPIGHTIISKKKDNHEDVKYEEDSSENSSRRKRGRPKKNPEISSQVGQQQYSRIQIKQKKNHLQPHHEPKIEEAIYQNKKKSEQNRSRLSQSNENDLCKALLLMKQTLPNRSLQKIIIKLHESLSSQESISQLLNGTINKHIENQQQIIQKNHASSHYLEKALSSVEENEINESFIDRLVVPEKKASVYHDKPGHIAALQSQEHKEKNMNMNEVVLESHAQASLNQQKWRTQNKSSAQYKIFSFRQCNMLKTVFYNPLQEDKYKERRLLAQLFVQRGYGVTKAIDDQLPPIDIDRNRYKNLLGGILTMAFRKLQSFMTNQCHRTIKYIDREQMKSLSGMLLNCRVRLEPLACQTFLKFLRVAFALGDVSISQSEAIELYVDACRHLYGKNITIEQLQNIGKVSNCRQLDITLLDLKKKAQLQRQKTRLQSVNSVPLTYQALPIQEKEQYIWTTALEAQFVHLYNKYQNLLVIQEQLGQKYAQLDNYTFNQYQKKLKDLLLAGLAKIRQVQQHSSSIRLCDLQDIKVSLIHTSNQGGKVRSLILSQLMGVGQDALEYVIGQINDFVDRKDLQNVINDIDIQFSQLGNESESLCQGQQNDLIQFDNGHQHQQNMQNYNQHIISQLFY